ncbi:YcaO-like family protein [Plantactinospora sp. GCM10030261]|uniref:YcaO-like family protein n=1 Tax=Plantactinospora sp. GCM10030261 TaxID=3273420 RepID=UPI00360BC20E
MPPTSNRSPLLGPAIRVTVPEPAPTDRWPIEDLVGAYGIAAKPRSLDTRGWLPPDVSVYVCSIGDVGWLRGAPVPEFSDGAGRTYRDPELARRISICEAVERYAGLYSRPAPVITATGRELGSRALALDEVARCSAAESRRSDCPVVAPDLDAPIRWTEAMELTSQEHRLIPLMMARMCPPVMPAERFWLSMSTGCALHRTPTRALLGGLYEVIERDSISVAWLRRLPLPRLDPAAVSTDVAEIVAWFGDRHVTLHLFDATTDVAVPAVLCVVESPNDRRVSQVIGSAAGFDVPGTALKAVLEATVMIAPLSGRIRIPRRYRDFTDPMAGAANMARASRRRAFSFLIDGAAQRATSRPYDRTFGSPDAELAHVLDVLRSLGMTAYATDLTPPEVAAAGYTVVQVQVPALQPASLAPQMQYRGHPRLRHPHPAADGVPRQRDLNRWPLPIS